MRLKYLLLILLSILTLEIVYAQNTTLDSCDCDYPNVCYTPKQDKNSLECFISNEKNKKLINHYIELTTGQDLKLELYETQSEKDKLIISDQKEVIKKKNRTIIKSVAVALLATIIALVK